MTGDHLHCRLLQRHGLNDWLFHEVKQRNTWLVPGWVTHRVDGRPSAQPNRGPILVIYIYWYIYLFRLRGEKSFHGPFRTKMCFMTYAYIYDKDQLENQPNMTRVSAWCIIKIQGVFMRPARMRRFIWFFARSECHKVHFCYGWLKCRESVTMK